MHLMFNGVEGGRIACALAAIWPAMQARLLVGPVDYIGGTACVCLPSWMVFSGGFLLPFNMLYSVSPAVYICANAQAVQRL